MCPLDELNVTELKCFGKQGVWVPIFLPRLLHFQGQLGTSAF